MMMMSGMATALVNRPMMMKRAQKNSAKTASDREAVDPSPKKL